MADEYRNGWVKRTESGVDYWQFERVRVLANKSGKPEQVWIYATDKIGLMPTVAEAAVLVGSMNRIQKVNFAGDPPLTRALLGIDGHVYEVLKEEATIKDIGMIGADVRILWGRVHDRR